MQCFFKNSEFLFIDGSIGKNVFIFRVDMSSFLRIGNKKKDTLILGTVQT